MATGESGIKRSCAVEKLFRKIAGRKYLPGKNLFNFTERKVLLDYLGQVVDGAVGSYNDIGKFKHKVKDNG
jgi:hypothetical protein